MTDKIISKLVDLSIAYGEMQYKVNSFIGEHDKNGNETTSINNSLAGILITDLINDSSTIQGVLEDLQIGEVMGYKKEGDVWLDKDGKPIANETAMDKILNGLYDETVTSISNIKIDNADIPPFLRRKFNK